MAFAIRFLAVALSIAIAGAGFVYWKYAALPHPRSASEQQLSYWLVLRDLDEQPHDVQAALVERLVNNTNAFSSSRDSDVTLSSSQVQQLRENLETLKFVWFQDRVGEYGQRPDVSKWIFLENQIDVVGSWALITMEHADVLYPDAPPDTDYSAMMFDEVELWLEKTPAADHAAAYQAVTDAIVCWLGTDSLEKQTPVARLELASRITREMDLGTQIDSTFDFVPSDCQTSMAANVELLVEAWLLDKADAFDEIAIRSDKNQFVDELIEKVNRWGVIAMLGGLGQQQPRTTSKVSNGTQPANSMDIMKMMESLNRFSSLTEQWASRATAERGKRLNELTSLIKRRLMASVLKGSQ